MKFILKRLIRIYTPFICAIIALVNGVLYFCDYSGIVYRILSEFTGHSILLIAYILSTCNKMCIWYKITNYILVSIHVFNIIYYYGYIDRIDVMYIGLLLNIFALLTFLIYRVSVGITKFLC